MGGMLAGHDQSGEAVMEKNGRKVSDHEWHAGMPL